MHIQGSNNIVKLPVRRELGVSQFPPKSQANQPNSLEFGMCPACWTALLVTIGQYVGGTAIGAGLLVAGKKLKNRFFPAKAKNPAPEKPASIALTVIENPKEKPCCQGKKVDQNA